MNLEDYTPNQLRLEVRSLRDEIEQKQKRIEQLETALHEYGQHHEACSYHGGDDPDVCDCGYNAAWIDSGTTKNSEETPDSLTHGEQMTDSFKPGDYVLATKYEDGDPGDQWSVGFFDSVLPKGGGDRYMVVDGDGKQFRGNGFRRCEKITTEQGAWLLTHEREIEASIPHVGYDEDGNWFGRSVWDWLKEAGTEKVSE